MFAPQLSNHPMNNVAKFCLLPFVILTALALIGGYIWMNSLPSDWEVSRQRTMAATPAEIHPHFNDLQAWEEWGIWFERASEMEVEYQGAAGVGQTSTWTDASGSGTNEILASSPNSITFRTTLAGFPPFESEVTFTPLGDETLVRWRANGTSESQMGKLFGLMADEYLGHDYSYNLDSVADLVEGDE